MGEEQSIGGGESPFKDESFPKGTGAFPMGGGRPSTLFSRWSDRLRAAGETFFGDPVFRQKLRFFRGILLFRELRSKDLARVVKKTMEKTYGPGEFVFQEGHLGRAFFIVAEGRVEVVRSHAGTVLPDAVVSFGPGDFFGEMVLLEELPRSATCRAIETTRLYVLYKDHFDELRDQVPGAVASILHALARLLSARLRTERRLPLPGIRPPS